MTEDEAKTKWCPFARTPQPQNYAANRTPKGSFINSKCLGSECMAWRWNKAANPNWKPRNYISSIVSNPYLEEPSSADSQIEGYCGLAGKSGLF